MITVDGSNLYLGESGNSEENSIMDISFVTQNEGFDYLLDLDNEIIHLSPGEIAVRMGREPTADWGVTFPSFEDPLT